MLMYYYHTKTFNLFSTFNGECCVAIKNYPGPSREWVKGEVSTQCRVIKGAHVIKRDQFLQAAKVERVSHFFVPLFCYILFLSRY